MSKKKQNNFIYVLLNGAGLPIGEFDWYGDALEIQNNRKDYTIIKKEFIKGRW